MDVVNGKGGSISGRSATQRMLRSSSLKFQEDEGISSNNNNNNGNSQEKKEMNHNMHSSSIERQYKEYKTLDDIKKETSTLLTQSYLRKQGQYSKQLNMQRELEAETRKLQEELKKQIEEEQGVQLAESNAIQPNDELNLMISTPFDDSMLFDKNSTPSIPNYQPVNISASNLNSNNWYNLGSRINKHLYHKSTSIVSNGGLHQLEQPLMFHTGSSDAQDCDTSIKKRSNKLAQGPTTQQPVVAFDDCDLREENDEAGASKARLKIPGYQFTPLPPRLAEKSGQLWQQSPRMASRELGQSHRSSQVSSQRMNTRRSSLGVAPYKTDMVDMHNVPTNQTFVVHKTRGNSNYLNPPQTGYFSGSPSKNGENSQRKAEITSNSSPIYAETASFNSGNVQNNGIQQVPVQPPQPPKKQLTNKSLGNPTFADTFLAFPKQQSLPYPTQQHSNLQQQLLLPPGVASDGFSNNNYFSQFQDFQTNNPASLMSQTIQTAGFRSSALPPTFPSPGQSPFFQQKQALQESRCCGFSFMQSQGCVDWSMPSIQTLQKQNSGIDYERKQQNFGTNNNLVLEKLDQFTLLSFDNKDTVNQDNQSKRKKADSGSSGVEEKSSNMSSIREEVAYAEGDAKEHGNNKYEVNNGNMADKNKSISREKDIITGKPTTTTLSKTQSQNYIILSHQRTSLFIAGYRSVYCNEKFQFSRTCKPDSCLVFSQQEDPNSAENHLQASPSHWVVERIQFPTAPPGDCSSSISSLNAHEGVSRDDKNNNHHNNNSNNSSTAHQSYQSSQNNLPQIDYLNGHSRVSNANHVAANKPQSALPQDLLFQVKSEKLCQNIVYVIENYRVVAQEIVLGTLNRYNDSATVKIQVIEQYPSSSSSQQKSSEILIETTFALHSGVKYYLGRHSACQIVIPTTATLVSARHCYFEFIQADNHIIIADNASSNGTWKCVEELQLSSGMEGFHFKFDGGSVRNDNKNNNNNNNINNSNNMITIQEINTKSMSASMRDNICQGCQEQHEQKNQQQYPEYEIVLMNQQNILTGYCFRCFRQLQIHQDYSIRLQI